jgi:hypothetical protein
MLESLKCWKPTLSCTIVVRFIGIALFAASFPMPDIDAGESGLTWSLKDSGFSAFLMTPIVLIGLLESGSGWRNCIAGVMLVAGWVTNFTMFIRVPESFAWIPISVPWLFFISFWLEWYPNGSSIVGYLPFYFWAAGIGLFHGAVYFDHQRLKA